MERRPDRPATRAPVLVEALDPSRQRPLGRTGLEVSLVGLGTGPIGNLYAEVSDDDARRTIDAALAAGLNHFDTAPLYGAGLAEGRLGARLRRQPRDSFVLSTKAGFLVRDGDEPGDTRELALFVTDRRRRAVLASNGAGIRASLEESLERLGLDRVDILYLHEPERAPEAAFSEALPALIALRRDGLVRGVGLGSGDVALLTRAVAETDIDVVLLSGGWTIVEQSAGHELLPLAAARSVAVVLGSVFHGGLVVDDEGRFDYPWAGRLRERVEGMRKVAARHGVAAAAAAIRFALAGQAVSSVLVGARTAAELTANIESLHTPVPLAFWDDLVAAGLLEARWLYARA